LSCVEQHDLSLTYCHDVLYNARLNMTDDDEIRKNIQYRNDMFDAFYKQLG